MTNKKFRFSIVIAITLAFNGLGLNLKTASIQMSPAVAQFCKNIEIRTNGNRNQTFSRNTKWNTCNGYKLIFQEDGNLVLYRPSGQPIWATGTEGSGERLALQTDGNVVLYERNGKAIWATNTDGNSGGFLAIQTDGNIVVYRKDGKPIWATNTDGGQSRTRSAANDWRAGFSRPSPPTNSSPSSGISNISRDTPFLPFDPRVTLLVTQGYQGSYPGGSHSTGKYVDLNRYAVDFGTNGKRVGARSTRYGQVVYAGWRNGGYGNLIIVKYSDGNFGHYLHLDQIWVRDGDWVAGGQGLGLIGSTGNVTGPHLHYHESRSSFGNSVRLPQFADAPNADFTTYGFSLTSKNPDNRR